MAAAAFFALQRRHCDHQSDQRRVGGRADPACEGIKAANGAFETVPVAQHAEPLRQDRPHRRSVALNGGTGTMSFAPIGGYKRSGIGREYGPNWLREYQHEKSVFYPIGR